MKKLGVLLVFIIYVTIGQAQHAAPGQIPNSKIPSGFVERYYKAYSDTPTSEKLAPFYHDSVVLEDPTFDFVGSNKAQIFKNFTAANRHNFYQWRIDQEIRMDSVLVTEGNLFAKYHDIPYEMRFVNIFHFNEGKIIRQFDYYHIKGFVKAKAEWNAKSKPGN